MVGSSHLLLVWFYHRTAIETYPKGYRHLGCERRFVRNCAIGGRKLGGDSYDRGAETRRRIRIQVSQISRLKAVRSAQCLRRTRGVAVYVVAPTSNLEVVA